MRTTRSIFARRSNGASSSRKAVTMAIMLSSRGERASRPQCARVSREHIVAGRDARRLRPGRPLSDLRSSFSSQKVPNCHAEHVSGVLRQFAYDRTFESRMHGAIGAECVLARLPVCPVRAVPEVVK